MNTEVLRNLHSQHTNTQTVTPSKNVTPRTHHTRFILMLATCDAYRAHRHGSESPYPGSTPGLNPCNHLARQACGPWRTHRYNTYIQTRRQWRHEELKIHRNRREAQPSYQPRRRGHHRAGGAGAVAVEAGEARAGEAEVHVHLPSRQDEKNNRSHGHTACLLACLLEP